MDTITRYRFRVEYLGTKFAGWQYQPQDPTIQGALIKAFAGIGIEKANIIGAGRTDAGVHATGQVAHVDLLREWQDERLEAALNANLPVEIRVANVQAANHDFHARFKATGRSYVFRLTNKYDPFRAETEIYWDYPVKRDVTEEATQLILGRHDFGGLIIAGGDASPVCEVRTALWQWEDHRFRFRIYADRYGWKMVRRLIATILAVGRKKFPLDYLTGLLNGERDSKWNDVVPAHGLFYAGVTYPNELGGPETPQDIWYKRTDW